MKIAYVLFAAAAWTGGAFAATSAADREFVAKAAHSGMEEVALGRLATEQGQSDAVKRFGQQMVDDHTRANEELKAAASKDGIELPSDAGTKKPGTEKLASLQGAEFDRAYAKQMVQDHEKAVALFRREAQGSGSSNVKAFAQKTLPTLEEHLRMAQQLTGKESMQGMQHDRRMEGMERNKDAKDTQRDGDDADRKR